MHTPHHVYFILCIHVINSVYFIQCIRAIILVYLNLSYAYA
jgi:hypothetical protein